MDGYAHGKTDRTYFSKNTRDFWVAGFGNEIGFGSCSFLILPVMHTYCFHVYLFIFQRNINITDGLRIDTDLMG